MEEEKVIGSTATIPKIDIRKLDFDEGEDANTVWKADLKTAICATREGLIKSMLFTIVTTGKCYEPTWPTEATVKQKYPGITEKRQQDLIIKKLEEKAAYETTHLDDARGTSHSILKGMMSKSSIDVLVTDMEYKANAKLMTPDPAITYGRIDATHILERNGKDLQRMVLSKTKLIHQFTELKQGGDHIVDYLERNERSIHALKVAGVDIKSIYKTDEELIIKFLYGLCSNRYGGFIRDVSNKLISIPNTFAEVISLAKERKELSGQDRKSRADSTAFLTEDSSIRSGKTDTDRSDRTVMITIMGAQELHPLIPYDRIVGKDWSNLSSDEKIAVTRHNRAIETAGAALAQKGWVDGKYPMTRNPTKDVSDRGRHSRFKKKVDDKGKEKEKKDHSSFLTRMQQADDDEVEMNIVLMMDGDEVIDLCSPGEKNTNEDSSVDNVSTNLTSTILNTGTTDLRAGVRYPQAAIIYSGPTDPDTGCLETNRVFARVLMERQMRRSAPLPSSAAKNPAKVMTSPNHLVPSRRRNKCWIVTSGTNKGEIYDVWDEARKAAETNANQEGGGTMGFSNRKEALCYVREHVTKRVVDNDAKLTVDQPFSRGTLNVEATYGHSAQPTLDEPLQDDESSNSSGPPPLVSDEDDTDSDQDEENELPALYSSSESEEDPITCGERETSREIKYIDDSMKEFGTTITPTKPDTAGSGETVRSGLSDGTLYKENETSTPVRTICEINMNYPFVDPSTLFAPVNHTYYYQDPERDNKLVDVFRSLQCYNDILASQPIAIARGVVIDTNEARDIKQPEADYLIQMSGGKILNCYRNAMQSPPQCLMSMSNDADGLIRCDTIPPIILTSDHNNAHAALVDFEGEQCVILYATRAIPRYTDIMWSYARAEASQPSTPYIATCTTKGLETFRDTVDRLESRYGGYHVEDAIITTPERRARVYGAKHAAEDSYDSTDPFIDDAEADNIVLATGDANSSPFDDDLLVLDCASGLNLCKSRKHASNIQSCRPGTVSGITGDGPNSTYHQSCNLLSEELGRVPLLPTAAANIISLATAKDRGFSVDYQNNKDEFTLMSPEGWVYTFGRMSLLGDGDKRSKFYVLDLNTHLPPNREREHTLLSRGEAGIPTVSGNKAKYTVRENKGAVKARQYMATMGYPPMTVALQQAKAMSNCPVTDGDIRRAFDIYGPSLAAIRGSTKQTKTAAAEIEVGTSTVQQEQSGEVDLMFVRGNVFVICILSPLEFSIVVPIKDKTAIEIYKALESMVAAAKAKGFIIKWIRSDNEPALTKAEVVEMLQSKGISVDKVAPGQHASKAERRIQFIKQKLRTIKAGLPYNMSMEMSMHAVLAANRFTNMQQASSSTSTLSPREKFLGRSFDYKKDGGIQFGTYVQATVVTTDNSDSKRTESCIALYPKEANTATMYVLKIKGQKVVARSNLIVMPLPDALLSMMDADAEYDGLGKTYKDEDEDAGEEAERAVEAAPEGTTSAHFQPTNAEARKILQMAPEEPARQKQQIEHKSDAVEVGEAHEQLTETNQVEAPVIKLENVEVSPAKKVLGIAQALRRSSRLAYNEEYPYFQPPDDIDRVMMATCKEYCTDYVFNMTSKQAIRKHGEIATASIRGELTQLIKMDTFGPVRLTIEQRKTKGSYICSKMFVKEKLLPSGMTDKIKSRLVGRGDMQARENYGDEDLSATTADLSSVLITAGVAAKEERKVASLDVGSAYLNAPMDPNAPAVILKIDATNAAILASIDPTYTPYLTEKGELFVKLRKCIYGCIESAKRWQAHLTATLTSMKLDPNPQDRCVFNMIGASGNQVTVVVYVDDLLITGKEQSDIDTVVAGLRGAYPEIKYEAGLVHNYLGMTLDFSVKGTVSVTMDGMVKDIVATSITKDLDKKTTSPARDNLFTVDHDEELVHETQREAFHSTVMKIAYVARRVRPECLAATSFLQTRVTKATPSDLYKLDQVIRYLHQTPGRGIKIRPGDQGIVLRIFADASYGIHWDGKSHSGLCIHLGDFGCIYVSSKRQSIVTKSSTEAELVCASDSGNQLVHLRLFLINQGYPMEPVVMFQDNLSTIALIEKGMSTSARSRHINVRYFWLKERIDEYEMVLVHRSTELMGSANILTKAVQGAQFDDERMQLTNW